jgi:hypothetical protein
MNVRRPSIISERLSQVMAWAGDGCPCLGMDENEGCDEDGDDDDGEEGRVD